MPLDNESRECRCRDGNSAGSVSRRAVLAGGATSAGLLVAGCVGGDSGSGDGTAKVGFLTHLSGRFGFAGEIMKDAADLAVGMINDAGGAAGADVELVTYDSRGEAQRAMTGFEKLLSDGVDVIIGPSSASIPNLMPLAQENEMPIVAITAGTSFLDDKGGEYLWRVTPSDTLLGRPQPLYALEQGWETMGVAYLDNQGSQSFGRSVAGFFESQGGEVVEEVALPPEANSYRSEIDRVVDADPDVVHVTASENGFPLFVQNWREGGIDIPLMGGNEATQATIIEQVGADAMEGVYGVSNVSGEHYEPFAEKFEEEYGEEPGIFAPESYDALNLAALAWEHAGTDGPQALVDGLRAVSSPDGTKVTDFPSGKEELEAGGEIDYEGAATLCNFDDNGDVYGSMAVMQATDGEWTETEVYGSSDLRTDD